MKKAVGMIILLIIFKYPLFSSTATFHAGVSAGVGFFSSYSSVEGGIKVDLSETLSLGLTQRIAYGFTYREITGMTELRTYVYDKMFFHLGASYLLIPSMHSQPEFNTKVLPTSGYRPLYSS